MLYSSCTDIDKATALVTEWDENNFGELDNFEVCAHEFNEKSGTSAMTAMDCMRILDKIVNEPDKERSDIYDLALGLYTRAEDFCDCTLQASQVAPSCDSFIHFKTLLHETLDACQALDEIDCAAWSQFYRPCKETFFNKFKKLDFNKNKDQCTFVKDGCGGAGSFPAFRKLDCGSEISKSAWDFYISYQRGCLDDEKKTQGDSSSSSTPHSASSSSSSSKSTSSKSTSSFNHDSSSSTPISQQTEKKDEQKTKAYVPYSTSKSPETTHKKKKSHHFFHAILLLSILVAGVVYYKKRQDQSFYYQRYRRQRNYQADAEELTQGLAGSTASSFEPPSLPPAP